MDRRLNGLNPLSYIGVNPYTPPELVVHPRPPTQNDLANFYLGTIWIDNGTNNPPEAENIWLLVAALGNVATWINFGGGGDLLSLTGDVGGPVFGDPAHNIDLIGDAGLEVIGDPATHSLVITSTGGGQFLQTLTGDAGGPVQPDGAGNINTLGTANRITTTGNAGTHTVTWDIGGEVADQYTEDVGVAVPALNNLNIFGAGGITTSGAGSTVTISAEGAIATTYTADAGVATPALNNINVFGDGGTISTSAAGSTITISSTLPVYATGLFTPVLAFGGASVGITYSRQNGIYTRIGNVVTIGIDILLTSQGSSTGVATVSGLPFPATSALADQDLFMTSINILNYPAGTTTLHAAVATATTTFFLDGTGSGVGVAQMSDTNFTNTAHIKIQGSYFI